MPTYDLSCPCGWSAEVFSFKPIAKRQPCPRCKKKTARIGIGGGSAGLLKGKGFYSTDNRSDGYKSKRSLSGMEAKHSERMSKAGEVRKTRREDG